jgi:NIMA-interacting peptidyl-prolyl cis-trans isomerase 1
MTFPTRQSGLARSGAPPLMRHDSTGSSWYVSAMRLVALSALVLAFVGSGCDKAADAPAGPSASVSARAGAAAPSSSSPATPANADPVATASAPPAPPETIIAQHILVAYKNASRAPKGVTRTKAEAKVRAAEALAKIQSGTTFEDAVRQYSDDAGSADRLGSVGKFRRDAMDPAFSAAAFALRVGQVSDVVETPFGFHVIKRTQ